MKRYGNLYDKICNIENIKLAHKNARKGKTHYKEVKEVDANIDYYCELIREMLVTETFVNSPYEVFIKNDKGKEREIYKLPYFPDRIVHHAIVQVVETIWKGTLIADTYQSIKGRGLHKAIKKIKQKVYSSNDELYYLKMDISKYYPSIDNGILKEVISSKIKCKQTIKLLVAIIDSIDGVPIGNYLSQYFGNLYVSKLDHSIKEVYRMKMYYRYCDDIVVIHRCKATLAVVCAHIKKELAKIKLKIKGNYCIRPMRLGLDFLGVIVYNTYSLIRKKIKYNYIISTKKLGNEQVLSSYNGWLRMCNSYNLRSKYEYVRSV